MNLLGYLQTLGKALMLPIATLPVAALLLRLGQPDLLSIPFMAAAGAAIFDQLPLLFALGIAVGLARDDAGAAALAGAVGYLVLTGAVVTLNAGIELSFFGGIIAGIIAGHSYNRFHAVRLPDYLGFFGGKRLVPIMTGLFCLLAAVVVGLVWPAIQQAIDAFGQAVASSGSWGQFAYGVLNRALIPVGLHHVLNSLFWFGLGECIKVSYEAAGLLQNICLSPALAGTLSPGGAVPGVDGASITRIADEVTRGDLNRFFAGDPTAGAFMAGFFPVMMFGLPAAALAMVLAAPKGRRAGVGGLLLSVALTSLLTGITEPLEFTFMFLAPLLYVLHALLTGLTLVAANGLGVLHGFGFSAGLFDLVLNWGLATHPWRLVGLGLVVASIYFTVFYGLIRVLNLPTPGRDAEASVKKETGSAEGNADAFIAALGGAGNIEHIDACITRLRLVLKNTALADDARLRTLGARGVVRLGERHLQVVLGARAEAVARAMRARQASSQ
ncbi:N-acetylglucosamine-specific PTS transporter subunit IIBC [Oceanimonas sp. CHS3-5]|uniref:N-acetylglucosamine-specific PTS transporter subunit IIBC n=1 Tax=Oceanimonas sp. CHS3-5 TaxID=3068186 RepID=UPI00273EE570|nr:N-acetylglucosamine-specific PTS transporter subunit IIBC [Oceanimonas sp. CHS3-5]MDP5291418.1 N-acetylglucosamine-specific PTS transporter subunit IIBC [Oceanimonas sp. CHS3-5]